MRIQPRQQLLEVWKAVARSSYPDGHWCWGGRDARNSISDAEQLLCLLGPATEISTFKVDLPDETARDVLEVLAPLGDSVEIPQLLVRLIAEYFRTYTDPSGAPTFAGGSYFSSASGAEPAAEQRELAVVDSFSVSVRLALATIGMVKVFRGQIRRESLRQEVDALEAMASRRLTAAMIGLLRSFAVSTFDIGSAEGRNLCQVVNAGQAPLRQVVQELQGELREVRAGLRDLTFGIGELPGLENDNKLFECGWSWGIVRDAPEVATTADAGPQPAGHAEGLPYLYFTVVALDCIQDLFSERTRILGLLDDEQQRLARTLQVRWDLTQRYWSKIARFGDGTWPLEQMPWRTTDGVESDYLSLLVSSIVVQDLSNRFAPESDVSRVGDVLRELAGRARITRRPLADDPAVALHWPGFALDLGGSEGLGGPALAWLLSDFAPQLLKRTISVAGLLRDVQLRGQMVALADQVWEEHLRRRRLVDGPARHLWDQPAAVYDGLKPQERPSWYLTERVVGCLIAAAHLVAGPPLRSPVLTELATDLLAEADHLLDQELLTVSAEAGPAMGRTLQTVRATLRQAHDTLSRRPGTAMVLASDVLRELLRLAAARQDASRAG